MTNFHDQAITFPLEITQKELEMIQAAVMAYRELIDSPTSADRVALGDDWADGEVAAADAFLDGKLADAVRAFKSSQESANHFDQSGLAPDHEQMIKIPKIMAYSLTQEQINEAITGKNLRSYDGWLAAAEALLAEAPEWTGIVQPDGLYVVKAELAGESGIFSCAISQHTLDPVYNVDDLGEFDRSAWSGESWDGLAADENVAALTAPVFVALRHE